VSQEEEEEEEQKEHAIPARVYLSGQAHHLPNSVSSISPSPFTPPEQPLLAIGTFNGILQAGLSSSLLLGLSLSLSGLSLNEPCFC